MIYFLKIIVLSILSAGAYGQAESPLMACAPPGGGAPLSLADPTRLPGASGAACDVSFDSGWYASPYFLSTAAVTGPACGSGGLAGSLLLPYPLAAGVSANVMCYRGPADTPASCTIQEPVQIFSCGKSPLSAANYAYRLQAPGAGACARACLSAQAPAMAAPVYFAAAANVTLEVSQAGGWANAATTGVSAAGAFSGPASCVSAPALGAVAGAFSAIITFAAPANVNTFALLETGAPPALSISVSAGALLVSYGGASATLGAVPGGGRVGVVCSGRDATSCAVFA